MILCARGETIEGGEKDSERANQRNRASQVVRALKRKKDERDRQHKRERTDRKDWGGGEDRAATSIKKGTRRDILVWTRKHGPFGNGWKLERTWLAEGM